MFPATVAPAWPPGAISPPLACSEAMTMQINLELLTRLRGAFYEARAVHGGLSQQLLEAQRFQTAAAGQLATAQQEAASMGIVGTRESPPADELERRDWQQTVDDAH